MSERRKEQRIQLKDIAISLNPGTLPARLEDISYDGLALRYLTTSDAPLRIEEIVLFVDGFAHTLKKTDFTILHDREVQRSDAKGQRLRQAGVRFTGHPFEWLPR